VQVLVVPTDGEPVVFSVCFPAEGSFVVTVAEATTPPLLGAYWQSLVFPVVVVAKNSQNNDDL
jgi:hypothetical protein